MTTAEGTINYEALAHEAMRGVVRAVLVRTAKSGLPGEHHFYISFDTQYPGVGMSRRLKEKYPEEMTIVMQHRFWDLSVSDERFEVKLTFDGIPERLVVPFLALKVFYDPSVRYGLQFEETETGVESGLTGGPTGDVPMPLSLVTDQPASPARPPQTAPRKRATRKSRAEHTEASDADTTVRSATDDQLPRRSGAPAASNGAEPPAKAAPATGPGNGAQIVSLNDFRKK